MGAVHSRSDTVTVAVAMPTQQSRQRHGTVIINRCIEIQWEKLFSMTVSGPIVRTGLGTVQVNIARNILLQNT